MNASDTLILPPGWEMVALADISEIKGGVTVDKKRTTEGGRAVPYLRVANVQEGYLDLEHLKEIVVGDDVIDKLKLERGDILLNEGGDRDKLGRGWIWKEQIPLCIHQNHVFRARLKHEDIMPEFVSYYANAFGKKYFFDEGKQTTNLASISLSKLKNLPLPLAPKNEQSRIVSKIEELFSDLDKGEESLRQAQAQLKRYRQSVLKAAVTGELTRDWREQNKGRLETGEVLLKRILKARRESWEKAELEKMRAKSVKPKDDSWKKRYVEPKGPDTSGLPELPEGWVWATFGQLGEFGRGKSKHRPRNDPRLFGGKYPFLQTGTVRASNGRIKTFDNHYSDFGLAQSKLWPAGTICITIAANIAESGILSFDACFPDSVVGLVPDKKVVGEYIEFFVRTARNELDAYAPATAQKNINLEILESVAIPIPSTEEQREIYSKAWEILSVVDVIESDLLSHFSSSWRLRQSILKSAFSGTLVPQDPNDEPASELLKRIAAATVVPASPPPARRAGPRQKKREIPAPAKPAELPAMLPQKQAATGLVQLRKAAGMSQAEFAKAIGLNQAYISQMENGKRAISNEIAQAMSIVLEVDPKLFAV